MTCQGLPGRLVAKPRLGPQQWERNLQPGRKPLSGVEEPVAVAGNGICASWCTVTREGSEARSLRSQMGGVVPEKLPL